MPEIEEPRGSRPPLRPNAEHVFENASPEAKQITDEHAGYPLVGKSMLGGHYRINHSRKQYARMSPDGTNVNTNTAESFFALLKRGHYGIFHKLSKRHLHRYCTEFAFRWTHRHVTDGERMVAAIEGSEGKRLKYRGPADRPKFGHAHPLA